MNKILRTAFVLAVFACMIPLLITPASAQSVYGSIFGTVTDATGAAIPDATVTVTDEAKGTVVTATSNASGDYSVPHLIPDVYDLKVTAKGFKSFETKGVSVQADTAPRIDPALEIGGETQTVEVNAESQPELKTDRADVSTVFDQQQVSSLPVGDQNFTNLQLLLPGAQLLGWSHAADENPQGSKQIQVDGQAFGGTAFELDGTDNQDPILGIIVINPAMDAITETKISTQNYDAELGKAVSAVVTAQTRSGTNKFHGSAYDFRTGNANLARDPYTEQPGPQPIPPGLKNRFGGSIGGPVIRDRAFFFFNYEAQRQKVGTSNTDAVPTSLMMSSCLGTTGPSGIAGCDFSDYAKAYGVSQLIYNNTADTSAATNTAFAANVIPTSLLSPQALALLKLLQPYAPNTGGSTGVGSILNNFAGTGTGLFNSDQWTVRGDYTLNQKAHAFGRFSRFTDTLTGKVMFGDAGGPGFGLGSPPYGGNSTGANDSLASGMDIALGPNLLTDFRLGYYRYNVIDSKYDQGVNFASDTLNIPGININGNFTSGSPGFIMYSPFNGGSDNTGNEALIGAGLGINRCNCPLAQREDQGQVVNNWTIIKGNHSLKIGADLRYARNLRVPSDTDRAGQLNFKTGPTSNAGSNGLGWATFMLGDVPSFGRYVSTSTNAKEFQKRTFFYAQDTWRATHNLTVNLGLRWELYFPESVNGPGNGSLMNLADGYMHVAGIGGIGTNMGWGIEMKKQFAPRIGATYQLGPKTVLRAGYGRSFDTGVFGSIFGHVVTQNLPVLANQQLSEPGGSTDYEFSLGPGSPSLTKRGGTAALAGPPAYVFPTVPSNGLLPAPGYNVSPKARPNPLHFPTIDAWNLSAQRAITQTLTLTIAYVGNKGTHTLGDGDNNNTNPNEAALFLPGAFSETGQSLNWDPNGSAAPAPGYTGGVSKGNFLQRYYGSSLKACQDPAYISIGDLQTTDGDPNLQAGMCGWTQGITNYSGDLNTEFDALQVTLAQQFSKGLAITGNYEWAAAFDDQGGYSTWDKRAVHGRDSNVRDQQLTIYGSYDFPFGKGKQYGAGVSRMADLIVGGYQLSTVLNWSGGLPFTLGYGQFNPWPGPGKQPADWNPQDCNHNVGGTSAPCRPNAHGHMKTSLTAFDPVAHTRHMWDPQPTSNGTFSFPGLDVIGNAGIDTYTGPSFFNTDLAITKAFTIHESIATKFRMDAFNAFNHINAANPNNQDIFKNGPISGEAPGGVPRQLEFSLRVQF
jgi:outer membrane receptor protein involved in Fe transport